MVANLVREVKFDELMDIYSSKIKWNANYKIYSMRNLMDLLLTKKGDRSVNYTPPIVPEVDVANITQENLAELREVYIKKISDEFLSVWTQYSKKDFLIHKNMKQEVNIKVLHDLSLRIDSYLLNIENEETDLAWPEIESRLENVDIDHKERLSPQELLGSIADSLDEDCVKSDDYDKFDLNGLKKCLLTNYFPGDSVLSSISFDEFKNHQETFKSKNLEVIFKSWRETQKAS